MSHYIGYIHYYLYEPEKKRHLRKKTIHEKMRENHSIDDFVVEQMERVFSLNNPKNEY